MLRQDIMVMEDIGEMMGTTIEIISIIIMMVAYLIITIIMEIAEEKYMLKEQLLPHLKDPTMDLEEIQAEVSKTVPITMAIKIMGASGIILQIAIVVIIVQTTDLETILPPIMEMGDSGTIAATGDLKTKIQPLIMEDLGIIQQIVTTADLGIVLPPVITVDLETTLLLIANHKTILIDNKVVEDLDKI